MRRISFNWPVISVLLMAALLVFWLSGLSIKTARSEPPDAPQDQTDTQVSVGISQLKAHDHQRTLTFQGHAEPWFSVDLKAEISAQVESTPIPQGAFVKTGSLMLQLAADEREVQLHQAQAAVASARHELSAAQELVKLKLISPTDILRLESELASARLDLKNAQLALARTTPAAPFDGRLDLLNADPGDYLTVGDVWGRLIDTRKLRIKFSVPQRNISLLEEGQPVNVRLLNGQELSGTISFIAAAADEATRSFRVEARVENPDMLRAAGASASVTVATGMVKAHCISPALLILNERGDMAAKYVDADSHVRTATVRVLSIDSQWAWIEGLPEETRIISVGAGFVKDGQTVHTVVATKADSEAGASN